MVPFRRWKDGGFSLVGKGVKRTQDAMLPNIHESNDCTMVSEDDCTTGSLLEELNEISESDTINQDEADLHWFRFGGVGKLYSKDNERSEDQVLERLKQATVAVIGLGGVGSWTAEALCRSGIGHLVLVDLDDICTSNTNRQLHALSTNVGRMKTDVMRDRLVAINPYCVVTLIHDFVMVDNVQDIVGNQLHKLYKVDVVIDAIDGDAEKAALLAACADHGIPILTTGNPTGRSDPTLITCHDLLLSEGDDLISACQDRLVHQFDFHMDTKGIENRKASWNIPCVYSRQKQNTRPGASVAAFRSDGHGGTACFVTGTIGFVAASRAVEMIVNGSFIPPSRGRTKASINKD